MNGWHRALSLAGLLLGILAGALLAAAPAVAVLIPR